MASASKGFSYADYHYAIKIQYICHLSGLSGHADYVFIPKQNVQIDFKQLLDLTATVAAKKCEVCVQSIVSRALNIPVLV